MKGIDDILKTKLGGALTLSFIAQMNCTFPTATLAHYTDGNVWKSDVVWQRLEIVNG